MLRNCSSFLRQLISLCKYSISFSFILRRTWEKKKTNTTMFLLMSENSKMSQIWHQVAQIPSEGTPWLSGFSAPDYDQSFLAETTWVMLQMLNPRRPTFGFVYTAGAVTSSSQRILSLLSSEHCSVTADCTRLISSFKRAFRSCGENVFVV